MTAPFVVFALPRSRTAWLSRFLSYGPFQCSHDEIRHCRSLDDVKAWLGLLRTGTVETAAAPFWRLLTALRPDARVVVVRRPVEDVVDSLMALDLGCFEPATLTAAMRRLDRKLQQIERRMPDVLSVRYAELADEATCRAVWEHCLPLPWDGAWWRALAHVNIQIDMAHCIRYFDAHRQQLTKLARLAERRILTDLQPAPGDLDGVTFQVEPFRPFHAEARPLILQHTTSLGIEDDYSVPMYEMLDDVGALQVATCRSNGRLFGYLWTIVGPSLEGPGITEARHTAFYASPLIKGLGMRLLRAANDALRERGVDAIIMRAGVRGEGPRIGALYRRLGAERFGELYRLEA